MFGVNRDSTAIIKDTIKHIYCMKRPEIQRSTYELVEMDIFALISVIQNSNILNNTSHNTIKCNDN